LIELNAIRERWGLRPYINLAEMHATFQAVPTANCWSRSVVAEPIDLATEFPLARQTGYPFLDESAYKPSQELLAFIDASSQDKPVYIGFGSLSAGDPREVTETVLRSLIIAGHKRCVMAGGWSGIGPEHLDPLLTSDYSELKQFADANVFKVDSAPHGWLLPLCCAAVHHGGAGTTGAVARAGIPAAIAPFAWDQPWWAERMECLGVGIALSSMITKVSVEELGLAVNRLTSDSGMIGRAAALGTSIRSELNGVDQLSEFVECSFLAPFAWPTAAQPVETPLDLPLWDRPAGRKEELADDSCGPDRTCVLSRGGA